MRDLAAASEGSHAPVWLRLAGLEAHVGIPALNLGRPFVEINRLREESVDILKGSQNPSVYVAHRFVGNLDDVSAPNLRDANVHDSEEVAIRLRYFVSAALRRSLVETGQ